MQRLFCTPKTQYNTSDCTADKFIFDIRKNVFCEHNNRIVERDQCPCPVEIIREIEGSPKNSGINLYVAHTTDGEFGQHGCVGRCVEVPPKHFRILHYGVLKRSDDDFIPDKPQQIDESRNTEGNRGRFIFILKHQKKDRRKQ